MKRILLLILLLCPFIVKAEIRDLNLINQYNTGYSEVYYMGDYFFLVYDVYNNQKDYAFAAMDLEGNYLYEYESPDYGRYVLFDYENVYFLYTLHDNNNYNLHIEKHNPKTGELINTITINDVDSFGYTYNFYFYEDSIGIDSHGVKGTNFVVKKDLSSYETVDGLANYDQVNISNPYFNYLPRNENNTLYNYLKENKIDEFTLSGNSILVGNYYYTYTYDSTGEIKPNLIMVDKEMEDYNVISVNNKDFYDGSLIKPDTLNITGIANYDGKVLLTLRYNGECILAQSPSKRFGDGCNDDTYVQIYKPYYNISTKTDGRGEIKVSQNNADVGEGITFEIIPEEGYVLGEVKVTDSEGNVVTFTDYKFTMPSADVLIEAVFIKDSKNPNTNDIINICKVVFLISLVTYLLSITVIKPKKKLI